MTTKISSDQVVMEGIGVSLSDFANNNTVSTDDLEAEALARQQAITTEQQARQQGDEAQAQALQAHIEATDPHPQYLTQQSALAQAQATTLSF